MSTTVKAVAQKACQRMGLGKPAAFVGSADETASRFAGLVEQAGRYCFDKGLFDVGIQSVEVTLIAGDDQGDINTIIPDLNFIIIDSAYYTDEETENASEIKVEIRNNRLLVLDEHDAGDVLSLTYQSKSWLLDEATAAPKDSVGSDEDVILLDEELMILATKVAFKEEMGLPAGTDLAARELRLKQLLMRSGVKQVLRMDLPHEPMLPAGRINLQVQT